MMGVQDATTRDFSLDVLGTKMQARSLDEALHEASLDWSVEKRKLTTLPERRGDELHWTVIPGKYAMMRTTVGETIDEVPLGVVGERYVPLQNRDAFGFVDDMLDTAGEELFVDVAGSMHNGRKVFVDVKLPKQIMVGGFDPVDARLLMTNAHDGTAPFSLSLHINRIPCTNAIEFVKRTAKQAGQHWTLRHTSSIEGRVQQAREQLKITWAALDTFEQEAQQLIAQTITDRQFERLVENIIPTPGVGASEKAKTSVAETRTHVRNIYRESPTQEGIRGTAWGALNAFVEWADWSREVRVPKSSTIDQREARAIAQLDSRHVVKFKQHVMGRVLAMK